MCVFRGEMGLNFKKISLSCFFVLKGYCIVSALLPLGNYKFNQLSGASDLKI